MPYEKKLSGWGNHPRVACSVSRPDRLGTVRALRRSQADAVWIARGLGRSYGDPATNRDKHVMDMTGLDRLIEFDPQEGVVTVEAGVSYADLVEVLLPRGFFPMVTPGTKFVTIGGAIAADVHGKNHHIDGSFNRCVESFILLTPTGRTLLCSREENSHVFWATLGGMGLTGFILTATIRLRRVSSAMMDVITTRVENLDQMLEHFAKTDADSLYSVAWIDCLARGKRLGRGVVLQGDHAEGAGPIGIPRKRSKAVPFDFPGFALNPLSVRAFNAVYYRAHPSGRSREDVNTYFYPLDAVHHWNRIYGKRGFVQYQPVFPEADGADGIRALIERLVSARSSSFLAVLKQMGGHEAGPLGFSMKGLTLAVDLPRTSGIAALLSELDRVVLDHGGRVYLAKDGSMSAATFSQMYPRLEEFQRVRQGLDPHGLLGSDQSRRLGITEQA
ncbi:MAG: FAD-binding oxidoreductase [Planctomycetota bacterium]